MSFPTTAEHNPEITPGVMSLADASPNEIVFAAEQIVSGAEQAAVNQEFNSIIETSYAPTERPILTDDSFVVEARARQDAMSAMMQPAPEQIAQPEVAALPQEIMGMYGNNIAAMRERVLGAELN